MEIDTNGMYEIKDFGTLVKRELYSSMAIPSAVHAYSSGVEYMKNWFLSNFKEYFKSVHVEGKHAFDDFRRFNKDEVTKRLKPALAIIPSLVFDYDRDKLDSYPYGLTQYMKRSDYDGAFFKDLENNSYIGMTGRQTQINFTFKCKVSSRAQQIDLYNYMQMALRVGYTQGEYTGMDFHIPYGLMVQLANDAGFLVEDEKIVDIIKFTRYLNLHSEIPIVYKLRTINGRNEFFLRIKEVYTHISCQESLSADDGEREGMISNNFIVELNATLKFPAPKMYLYYSETKHVHMEKIQTEGEHVGLYSVKIVDVPEINNVGWNQYLTTEYFEEDITKPLTIDFSDFFKNEDLGNAIDYNNILMISPSVFIDIKLYNQDKEIPYTMDWSKLILTTNENVEDKISFVSIYVDTNYLYKVIQNIDRLEYKTIPLTDEDKQTLEKRYKVTSISGGLYSDDSIIKEEE